MNEYPSERRIDKIMEGNKRPEWASHGEQPKATTAGRLGTNVFMALEILDKTIANLIETNRALSIRLESVSAGLAFENASLGEPFANTGNSEVARRIFAAVKALEHLTEETTKQLDQLDV